MKIGALAKRSGCSVQTIRYYENEGLIPKPTRTHGNFRLYDAGTLEKLSFIKNCRTLDLTLSEIKQLISLQHSPGMPCDAVNELIDTHLEVVQRRIADLENLFDELKRLRLMCGHARTVDQCGILEGLSPQSGNSLNGSELTKA